MTERYAPNEKGGRMMVKSRKWLLTAMVLVAVALGLLLTPDLHTAKGEVAEYDIAETFPDANFRKYVSDNFDENKDGKLDYDEYSSVWRMEISGKNISDLTGIGCFIWLDMLDCSNNKITDLSLPYLPEVGYVNAMGNPLKTMSVYTMYHDSEIHVPLGVKVELHISPEDSSYTAYQWLVQEADEWYNYNFCSETGAKTKCLSFTTSLSTIRKQYIPMMDTTAISSTWSETASYGAPIYIYSGPVISEYQTYVNEEEHIFVLPAQVGDTVKAHVTASGVGTLKYQWQVRKPGSSEWINSSSASATTPDFQLKVQKGHDLYYFRCIITDAKGVATYTTDQMWVENYYMDQDGYQLLILPTVTEPPTDKTAAVGDTVHFTIAATGKDIVYQWEVWNAANNCWQSSSAPSAETADFSFKVQSGHNGKRFRCLVGRLHYEYGDYVTYCIETPEVTLHVGTSTLKIAKQPVSTSVKVGATAGFTVEASGTGTLKYQWQAYNPNTKKWSNSSSESAKTKDFKITAQSGHNGFKFRCIVTDAGGNSVTSDPVTLTVNPAITTQPAAKTVPVGGTAEFSIVAKGAGTLKYQWQAYNPNTKKWSDSSSASAKTATLSITAQAAHHGFKFRCVVTDGNNNKTVSNAVILTVRPGLTAQPNSATVAAGATAKFTIGAKGCGTLSYQWQVWDASTSKWKNSGAASAKTAEFYFKAQAGHNGKKFRCIVTDVNGNKTYSRTVTLTVK